MTFFGMCHCLESWKRIIERELGRKCTDIEGRGRESFTVDLSKEDREFLQRNYWYVIEEGSDLPWNCRIAFEKTKRSLANEN